jgi:PrtD family type I secretion system ABC transporter
MQQMNNTDSGPMLHTEVGKALMLSKNAFVGIMIFSAFINILMLTGPLYMLQIYDRVLSSRSMSTLMAMSILMAAMFAFMGFFEFVRSRILVRVGDKLERDLSTRTFKIWMKQGLFGKAGQRNRPLQDLGTLKQFFSGAAPATFCDLPWAPFYIAVIFLIHWTLGVAALIGAIIIFIIATINELTTRKPMQDANIYKMQGHMFADASHRNADAITAMGMSDQMRQRWGHYAQMSAEQTVVGSDQAGGLTSMSKAFRMFVQSGILGLGGALAVQQIISPGAMIAASIIMGRALAPIQMALGQWRGFIAARQAFNRLNAFYDIIPEEKPNLPLPVPTGVISVENVIAAPPGSQVPVLMGLNFKLEPGQGLAVIGPSASGKSTLSRLLVGIWLPQKGSVRLDGATFDQWNPEQLGPHIGYLPQEVELFDGTIGENISRFRADASAEAIVLAARRAGVHDLILRLADGYDTRLGEGGAVLSGGQNQRIALARALFGDPVLVVLDEPNANLDADGDAALAAALLDLRMRKKTVITMTHRPSALASMDYLLMLRDGKQVAFGPKEEVIKEMTKSVPAINEPKQKKSAEKPKTKPAANSGGKKRVDMPSFGSVTPIKGKK